MRRSMLRASVVAVLGTVCLPARVPAATIEASVEDVAGAPVEDAVVFALPLGEDGTPQPVEPVAHIDQVDKEFVPYVTAVQVGTRINFPNRDDIRHHVYSFSPAKTFEIPLYVGTPREPILFDQPGPVALGCNIHDWMQAYVFVSPTPYFAQTGADGRGRLTDLAPGEYEVRVWHPRLAKEPEATGQRVAVGAGAGTPLRFVIEEKRVWRPRRAPSSAGGVSYR